MDVLFIIYLKLLLNSDTALCEVVAVELSEFWMLAAVLHGDI